MKVLVACEESQRVCVEFRKLGHETYSCDIIECSGGHPEWHIQGDVLSLLNGKCFFITCDGLKHTVDDKWDMIIAFPPCTYMSNAGACRMYPTKGVIDEKRYALAMDAKQFFMTIYNAECDRIAIENPRPLKVVELPLESQRIQPYMFGEPYSKLTYLWLKGLPCLKETNLIIEGVTPYVNAGSYSSDGKRRKKVGVSHSAKERSKTFIGIAKAMAEQWGGAM